MDPDNIELNNLSKSFAYQKLASEIDSCDDRDQLRNIAKSFIKLLIQILESLTVPIFPSILVGISNKLLILKTHQTLPLILQVIRGRVR